MAGGASCPALAAAVSEAGGLGFLAAGYKTPEAVREEVVQLRALLSGQSLGGQTLGGQTLGDRQRFGVNLFLPQPEPDGPTRAAVAEYRRRLAVEAERLATPLGDPDRSADDDFDAKVELLLADPVPVVSFTFGCPSPEVLKAFADVGTVTVATVTGAAEAVAARQAGADALCVQGVEAGGHQGTHRDDPRRDGSALGLLPLLAEVREAVPLPLVAAGGLMRGAQIAAVLAAGADAAQLGTAFLPCPESGAHPLHRQALTDPGFGWTELTRAFSGRPARGLVNRFMREHGGSAPSAYPQVHHLTAGLRQAAARSGDPQGMALWAGQGHRLARPLPAGELVRLLAEELRDAQES